MLIINIQIGKPVDTRSEPGHGLYKICTVTGEGHTGYYGEISSLHGADMSYEEGVKMAVRGILFDLDGTLIDTNDLIIQSLNHTLMAHIGRQVPVHELTQHFGKPLAEHFSPYGEERCDDMIRTYREFNFDNHDRLVCEYPNVKSTLSDLVQRGYKLGVVTSKIRKMVVKGLDLFSLGEYFDCLVCAEDTDKHKPAPEPVLKALDQLCLQPGECLMVGDSPYDIISAKAAGVATAAVEWSTFDRQTLVDAGADYFIEDMPGLLALLETLTNDVYTARP